jgi:hypothetical protein
VRTSSFFSSVLNTPIFFKLHVASRNHTYTYLHSLGPRGCFISAHLRTTLTTLALYRPVLAHCYVWTMSQLTLTDASAKRNFYDQGNAILRLPRELRDAIYALTMTHNNSGERPDVGFWGDSTLDRHPPPIMVTCKQMYCEAEPFYFEPLTFVVESHHNGLKHAKLWMTGSRTSLQKQRPVSKRRRT